jgi:hypothetical protein
MAATDAQKAEKLEEHRDAFVGIISATKPDGTRRFSNDEVEHYLPLFILQYGLAADPAQLGNDERVLLEGVLNKAGIKHKATAKEALAAFEAYYGKHPVNAELDRRLSEWARTAFGARARDAATVADALAAFAALDPKARVLGGGARPEGTLPGGVLGRLAATTKK